MNFLAAESLCSAQVTCQCLQMNASNCSENFTLHSPILLGLFLITSLIVTCFSVVMDSIFLLTSTKFFLIYQSLYYSLSFYLLFQTLLELFPLLFRSSNPLLTSPQLRLLSTQAYPKLTSCG